MNSPDSSPAEGWPRNQPLEHAAAKIFTIGHSVIPPQRFIEILKTAGIETLVDVRSTPYSRRVPHANRENLQPTITREGIEYLYLGDYLGGMPRDPALLGPDGRADDEKVAASTPFRDAIEHLIARARKSRVCMMCAEEDPAYCHRTRLIAPALLERGCSLLHLRHDGSTESQASVMHRLTGGQLELF
ncbi:MAG: DUF488 domain-containing protein [Planctomycetota bacterium]